jgi:hypothetical protein
MKDLNAPIVPNESAAGLTIGQKFSEDEFGIPIKPFESLNGLRKYSFGEVSIWVSKNIWEDNGIVTQIGLHHGYLGQIKNTIGIGSCLEDVSKHLNTVEEDEWDNLIARGISGVAFESEQWDFPENAENNLGKKVTDIFIFSSKLNDTLWGK